LVDELHFLQAGSRAGRPRARLQEVQFVDHAGKVRYETAVL